MLISNQGWILYSRAAQQITKADRNACHTLCINGKARATLRRLSSTVICIELVQVVTFIQSLENN